MEQQQDLPGIPQKEKRKRKSRQYYLYQQTNNIGDPATIIGPNPSEAACIALAPTDGDYEILVKTSSVTVCTVTKKEIKKK